MSSNPFDKQREREVLLAQLREFEAKGGKVKRVTPEDMHQRTIKRTYDLANESIFASSQTGRAEHQQRLLAGRKKPEAMDGYLKKEADDDRDDSNGI
jgi:hypothetical protein